MKLYDAARVGGDILSYCGKCKMDLAHVVVAMVDRRAARVICKTCRSEHRFKSPTGETAGPSSRPAAKTPRSAPSRTTVRAAEYWEQKLAEKKADPMVPYDVKRTFAQGEVMTHPTFGVGIIQEVKRGGKIVVLFRDGDKVLVHSLGAASQNATA